MLNNIFNTSLISFGLIFLCFISIHVISNPIYAEIFEFNEEDYYSSQDDDQTNSQDRSADFEDTSSRDSFATQDDDDQPNSRDQSLLLKIQERKLHN